MSERIIFSSEDDYEKDEELQNIEKQEKARAKKLAETLRKLESGVITEASESVMMARFGLHSAAMKRLKKKDDDDKKKKKQAEK